MSQSRDSSQTAAPAPASDTTRERILTAAMEEFARHGIAGARVDRIAKLARTSKERVYTYFRSKDALYAAVSAQEHAVIADATQLDPSDLPGYAGRLFDYFVARPDHHRLITWGRLELPGTTTAADEHAQVLIARKIDLLRQAQQAGHVDPVWDPADVLALVNQIATTWAAQPELSEAAAAHAVDPTTAARRAAVVTAVEQLFPRAR
ncbi:MULTISPECIES: TetR family transcriptional regulator [Streptomyces]|uniref:AcrR family transcriptional regulator n=1 Tax=Streptomyces stelliscabiei TaxID=146820 RepID=A0A8I0NWX4_9ACTN|nr:MULTISPECIES: TetR family transcriptional regulator [Streptomyces]KND23848.1 TetR family transcriptional regulator [Streptomyces stelliscabiei]MBE1593995.1 AcrR family transcriptional regulator [Streptomyces stelliscabiei]MDX2521439.1 TetR family transcriptional regulator [Streptomyces stelliscabiei]MDX2556185.1 TetR family transcriptional regulator [Streptomyces stelliscabiei]MDX2616773.1 TetR family transcriptional regulator [Streptomyces stelliscabiei]